MSALDVAAISTLQAALEDIRSRGDERPPLVVLAATLADLGVPAAQRTSASIDLLAQRRSEWL